MPYYMFIFARLVTKLVEIINKVVVGSSCRDAPKYVGEGVALRGTPGTLGVLWPQFSYSMAVFRHFLVGALWTLHIQSASSYFLTLHH